MDNTSKPHFQPEHIAVVGASTRLHRQCSHDKPHSRKFSGKLLPVNPKYKTLHGLHTFRSVSDLDAGIDLAVISTPMQTVPGIVKTCVKRKIAGAIIISAGGKEAGEKGRSIEQKILKTAYDGGLRIIGPNRLGIMRPGKNLNASFASEMPASGNLAFVSQSGAICTAVLDLAFRENFGFSHFVSTGSMLDVDFGDMKAVNQASCLPQAKCALSRKKTLIPRP